jgi:hypothetical protein
MFNDDEKDLMMRIVLEDLCTKYKTNRQVELAKENILNEIFEYNGLDKSFKYLDLRKSVKLKDELKETIEKDFENWVDKDFFEIKIENYFCGAVDRDWNMLMDMTSEGIYVDTTIPYDIESGDFEYYIKDYIDGEINYDEIEEAVKRTGDALSFCFTDYLVENHSIDFEGLKKYVLSENIEEYESLGLEIGVLENKKEAKKKKKLKP